MERTSIRMNDRFVLKDKNQYLLTDVDVLDVWRNESVNDLDTTDITDQLNELIKKHDINDKVNFIVKDEDSKPIQIGG